MIAREASLNDPEVVKLLSTQFVSLAVDNVANPNWTPAEKEFLQSFDSGVKACTIGLSAFTADGRKLASGGDYQPAGVLRMLRRALAAFKPEEVTYVPSKEGVGGVKSVPEGGLVLYVTWKILEKLTPEGPPEKFAEKIFKDSLGSDRLWVRKDEAVALAAGSFPESLKRRIVRYHIGYVMGREVKDIELTLRDGRLTGSFPAGDAGQRTEILGFVEAKNGTVSRFELLIKGAAKRVEDHGFSACLAAVPEGKRVPTALYFELADAREGLAKIVPHKSKDGNYLR